MNRKVWLWMDTGACAGAWNMALDRVLADVAVERNQPIFRVYAWNPWCISLGYHQDPGSVDQRRCREDGLDIVRRPTGGRAVLHAEEVTYSVLVPRPPDAGPAFSGTVYRMVGEGLVAAIRSLGVPADYSRRDVNLKAHYQNALSTSCFSAAARYEVTVAGKKLVGSAQRVLAGAVLQHGSILTGDRHLDLVDYFSDTDPAKQARWKTAIAAKTQSLSGYLKRAVSFQEVATTIRAEFSEKIEVEWLEAPLSPEIHQRADKLSRDFHCPEEPASP